MTSPDLYATLRATFRRPTRLRRLLALGPSGWRATWHFLRRVVPLANAALAAIRARAAMIPDAALRAQALASIDAKAYHVEGGCILATYLEPADAARYVAIVAPLETIYDYLDNLCDRMPAVTQTAYATLHGALLDALDDRRTCGDWYRDGPRGDDGGYLASLVGAVREGVRALPGYAAVRERLVETAGAYAELQVLKHGPAGARERACAAWYARHADRFPGLAWWEFAAACGSSLPVFALLYLASHDRLAASDVDATFAAYVPAISALHILLDYYIDEAEDAAHGELNFIACYPSRTEAIRGLAGFSRDAVDRARGLRDGPHHRFLVEAMCVFYLTHPKIFEQRLDAESATLLRALSREGRSR